MPTDPQQAKPQWHLASGLLRYLWYPRHRPWVYKAQTCRCAPLLSHQGAAWSLGSRPGSPPPPLPPFVRASKGVY